MGARREVVSAVAERYRSAGRREKGRILDELTAGPPDDAGRDQKQDRNEFAGEGTAEMFEDDEPEAHRGGERGGGGLEP